MYICWPVSVYSWKGKKERQKVLRRRYQIQICRSERCNAQPVNEIQSIGIRFTL